MNHIFHRGETMDYKELDFYRIRFDIETGRTRGLMESKTVMRTFYTEWEDHYPSAWKLRKFISENLEDSAIIKAISIDHEHYVRKENND